MAETNTLKKKSKIQAIDDNHYEDMLHIIRGERHLMKAKGLQRKTLIQKCRRGKLTVKTDPEDNNSYILTREYYSNCSTI